MEWRQQTSVSCADAFTEAQRWIEEVTGKAFGCDNFRAALENGVLLCDLINQLKPGIIRRLNRLSTPIAGLDNVNVFLKACGKVGLNESQLFHPGDLQDLSTRVTLRHDEGSRRLKNVLITIYWLGRKAQQDAFYTGPQLNFKAFEGLLGLALSKALDEGSGVFVREGWCPEREDCQGTGPNYKRENSVESTDSLDPRNVYPNNNNNGCGSDAEAEQEFKMEASQPSAQQNKGYMPPPLLRRRRQETGKSFGSPLGRSKSLSDIPMVYPVRKAPIGNTVYDVDEDANPAGEWTQENKGENGDVPKDGEAHWHDDLKKWKSRRRSTKSDLRTKSQDREHVINQMTTWAPADFKNETHVIALKEDQQSPRRPPPAPCVYPTSSLNPLRSDLRPHTRALLSRSYATTAPFCPTVPLSPEDSGHIQGSGAMPASEGNLSGEETHIALASDGVGVITPSQDCPFSSQTQVKAQVSPSPYQATPEPTQPEGVFTNKVSTLITTVQPKEAVKPTRSREFTAFTSRSQEETPKTSRDSAVEQGRGQQAAGYYKPWSSSASLPRGFRRSEGSSRLSSAITSRPFGAKHSRVSSLKRYNAGSASPFRQDAVDHSDMRVSLTLKPNSRPDFGFQTHWDSTGARVKYIEPGSPAELCQLCVDDEIVAVDGVAVTHMNYNQWKDKMTHALQNGSLTMDVRRYGNKDWSNGEWSHRNQPGQSRMTLNLTPEASTLIGCADHHANSAASADTAVTKVSKLNEQTENVILGKGMDVEHDDGYKKSSRGGSESAISDLQVPSLHPSSSSWSWDCEEDRRRQEKWQEEQERLLQEKYKQDQERLEAEWRKAQQDAFGDSCRKPAHDSATLISVTPGTTQPHVNGLASKPRDEWNPDGGHQKVAEIKSQRNAAVYQNDPTTGSECLSPAHRKKSMSTPVLSGPYKHTGGDQRKRKGQSKAEQERQQILEEMKKRTQLLTDNSWIRQRSSSFYKEPVGTGLPLKKHESLDNLDILHQSPVPSSQFSYPRPHSAAAGYSIPSRNSSSRYSTGAIMSQSSASGDHFHHGSVWAAADTSEELGLESRFDSQTGTPTVSPAITNSAPLMPPPCDAILHIAE